MGLAFMQGMWVLFPRFDFDCDGFSTALDLSGLIDHLFAGGEGPCERCGD
jgi:hypothetical protein